MQKGLALVNLSAEALLGVDGPKRWGNQIDFLKSGEGKTYTETLTTGIADYRKRWPRNDDKADETAEIIELHKSSSYM